MKTVLSLSLLSALAASSAFASTCSIKVYSKGQLIKDSQPALYQNESACASLANSIINGSFSIDEGKADAVEFSYTTNANETIKGALYK